MKHTMEKYKKNLKVDNFYIYSYNTQVAEINHIEKSVTKLGWWSSTTSKHINYVAREYGYEIVSKDDQKEEYEEANNPESYYSAPSKI